MKKRVYDFCTRVFKSGKNLFYLFVLFVVSIVISWFIGNLVLLEYVALFWWYFKVFGCCIAQYKKSTFLANKTITLLLADETACFLMLFLVLAPLCSYVTKQYVGNYLDKWLINGFGGVIVGMVISNPISKHFKKKVVYKEDIEPESAKIISFDEVCKMKMAHEQWIRPNPPINRKNNRPLRADIKEIYFFGRKCTKSDIQRFKWR